MGSMVLALQGPSLPHGAEPSRPVAAAHKPSPPATHDVGDSPEEIAIMSRFPLILCLSLSLIWAVPAAAAAQRVSSADDRISLGGNVTVARGETVDDVLTLGGNAVVYGHVRGDVVTTGGNLRVEPGAHVAGDVLTMGGNVQARSGATILGDIVTMGGAQDIDAEAKVGGQRLENQHMTIDADGIGIAPGTWLAGPSSFARWVGNLVTNALSYGLLFLLGLVFMGAAPERWNALQTVIIRTPLKAGGTGLVALVGAIAAVVVLVVTIVGIPAAVALGLLLPLAIYAGLAASASVIGAAIPIERLRGRPILQLLTGITTLFVASLVPILGSFTLAVAAVVGLGAMFITKLGKVPPMDAPGEFTPAGPYRTRTT